MSLDYFVEILNHSGDVQTRHKFSSLPIRIGRAYSNDVILEDPHTAPEHALIDIDDTGVVFIRDLGSHNGIGLKGKRQDQFNVHGDDIFRLGQTRLRMRTSHYVVANELSDDTTHHWEGWPLLISAIVIIATFSLAGTWLADVESGKTTAYVTDACIWLGMSALWAGIWALANRVFGGGAHFSRHLFILSCGVAALQIFDYLCVILAFSFSWEIFTRYSSHIEIAILLTTVYYHLRQINPRNRKRLQLICIALSLAGSGLMLMKNHQATNQFSDELYMHEMLPPAFRVSENHSLKDFGAQIDQLKKEIDDERAKALKEKENDKK